VKKLVLTVALVAAGLAAIPAISNAINITSSGSRTLTGNLATGTVATFTDNINGLIVTCDTHTARILTTDISTIGDPRPTTTSTATSAVIRRANNTYTSSNPRHGRPPLCDFTANGIGASGTARVTVTCDWILTAVDTRNGTVTLPCRRSAAQDNAQILLGGSGTFLDGAIIRVDEQSAAATIRSDAAPTRIILTVNDRTIRYTCRGCVIFTSGTATQAETLVIPTVGLS
jgi:hypothetical protein